MFAEIVNNPLVNEVTFPLDFFKIESEARQKYHEVIENNLRILKEACPPDEFNLHVFSIQEIGGRTYYLFDGKVVFWSKIDVTEDKILFTVQPWIEEE